MKVNQIISERKQLNEFVPLIGGLTIAGVLGAISVLMTAWSLYDIYKFIGKYQEEPENLTQSDWNSLFLDAILLAVPYAGKLGKAAIVKILPESWVAKGGVWMQTKIMDLIAKKGGADAAKAAEKGAEEIVKPALKQGADGWYWQLPGGQKVATGKGFKTQADALKWAKENPGMLKPATAAATNTAGAAAKTGAQAGVNAAKTGTAAADATKVAAVGASKFSKISKAVQNVILAGITADTAYNYYGQISDLEEQYQRVLKGDKTTKLFGDVTPEEAYKLANSQRTKLIGEVVVALGLSLGVTSKAFGVFGSIGKAIGTTVGGGKYSTGGTVLGAIGAAPGRLAAMMAKVIEGGPVRKSLFLIFMQTPAGKTFLENAWVEMFTKGVGIPTAATIDLGIQALEAAGVNVPDAVKTKITDPDPGTTADGKIDISNQNMPTTRSSSNPKIVYVNGVQISDENGYQSVGDELMNDIRADAAALKKPDPTAGIKKDPTKTYDSYGVR